MTFLSEIPELSVECFVFRKFKNCRIFCKPSFDICVLLVPVLKFRNFWLNNLKQSLALCSFVQDSELLILQNYWSFSWFLESESSLHIAWQGLLFCLLFSGHGSRSALCTVFPESRSWSSTQRSLQLNRRAAFSRPVTLQESVLHQGWSLLNFDFFRW